MDLRPGLITLPLEEVCRACLATGLTVEAGADHHAIGVDLEGDAELFSLARVLNHELVVAPAGGRPLENIDRSGVGGLEVISGGADRDPPPQDRHGRSELDVVAAEFWRGGELALVFQDPTHTGGGVAFEHIGGSEVPVRGEV